MFFFTNLKLNFSRRSKSALPPLLVRSCSVQKLFLPLPTLNYAHFLGHIVLLNTFIIMAKGVGLLGNIKGKLGNAVGYQIRNSNNRTTQGFRVYQPEVANPKTSGQAAQRMKMAPAVLFYRAFAQLLDHSWEGLKYGGQSHQYFMKLVMRNTFTGYPYLPLGTNFMAPGSYPMSRGSIAGFDITSFNDGQAVTSIKSPFAADSTLGVVSQALIDGNSQLQDGDQLTFAWVIETGNEESPYMVGYTRLVLDVESPVAFADVAAFKYLNWDPAANLKIGVTNRNVVAAAVIVSRLSDGDWLRSNSNLAIDTANASLADYFSDAQYLFARKTYEEQIPITSSKWYLNQASTSRNETSGGGSANGGSLVVAAALQLTNGSTVQAAYYNGAERQGFLVKDGMSEVLPDGGANYVGRIFTVENNTLTEGSADVTFRVNGSLIDITTVQSEVQAAGYTLNFTTGA